MKYETPKADFVLSAADEIMVASFEGNTLDLWDMLIGNET